MTGERAWEPLMQTEVSESNPTISPDGDWVAYSSDESGTFEVYVQRFPGLGERQQMSTGGGSQPLWSPDGRELFYSGPDQMMGVSVETGETLGVGNAEVLFQGMQQYLFQPGRRNYDISPDGERFLMLKPGGAATDESSALAQMILVQNWHEELERLAPTN